MTSRRTPIARSLAALACLAVASTWSETASAQAGSLDPSFDGDGRVTTDLGAQENGFATVVQPDGKIVVAGTRTTSSNLSFLVLRYNPGGDLDTSFGSGGYVLTDIDDVDQAEAVGLQPDGKIVVAGSTSAAAPGVTNDAALVRYDPGGTLDPSFGIGGIARTDFGAGKRMVQGEGYGLAIAPDGKILFGCLTITVSNNDRRLAVLRYHANGSPDLGFGVQGLADVSIPGASPPAMALQANGKIVLGAGASPNGGRDFTLVRFHSNGVFDSSFGSGGLTLTDLGGSDTCEGLVIQSDGKIVAAGSSNLDFALARYQSNGILDTGFGIGGVVVTDLGGPDVGRGLVLEAGGRIVVGGYDGQVAYPNFLLARYRADGSLDPSFGNGGTVETAFGNMTGDTMRGIGRQANGRIVLVGTTNDFSGTGSEQEVAIARYCAGLGLFELSEVQLTFFDQSVEDGTLRGVGPPRIAAFRLWVMRWLLRTAGRMIDRGATEAAEQVLFLAYLHTDGESSPRDYVAGPAAPALAHSIQELRFALVDPCNQ